MIRKAKDPTIFNTLASKYGDVVHFLLRNSSVDGLRDEELVSFKQKYQDSAFQCRFFNCARTSDGFRTSQLRDDHEINNHGNGIKCTDQDCSFNRIGFKKSEDLKRHLKKHHADTAGTLDRRFKRKRITRDDPLEQETGEDLVPQQEPDLIQSIIDIKPSQVPSHLKREGGDWCAVWNDSIRRAHNVDLVHSLPHQSIVCDVSFSKDGRFLATGCNRSAQIFDTENGVLVALLEIPDLPDDCDLYSRCVSFSPNGDFLAAGYEDQKIRVWHIPTKKTQMILSGHEGDITYLTYANDGQFIASCSGDRTVRLWDSLSGQEILAIGTSDENNCVVTSPDDCLVATGSLDQRAYIWEVETGNLLVVLGSEGDGHKDSLFSAAFSPSGKELITGSLDKTIKIWELDVQSSGARNRIIKSFKCIKTLVGHKNFVLGSDISKDGRWLLSSSKDRNVILWDFETGDIQFRLEGHRNSVLRVALSPTDRTFATAGGDMRARIWRYDDYRGRLSISNLV